MTFLYNALRFAAVLCLFAAVFCIAMGFYLGQPGNGGVTCIGFGVCAALFFYEAERAERIRFHEAHNRLPKARG